jgi:hypothetical protein
MVAGAKEALAHLKDKVMENASLTDHSLEDLKRLGYPYSRAHPKRIHTPEWLVHVQSGQLLSSVRHAVEMKPKSISALVYLDQRIAPHAKFVILGTRRMVSRDFLSGTLIVELPALRRIFSATFKRELRRC